jgi:hypothetical protein
MTTPRDQKRAQSYGSFDDGDATLELELALATELPEPPLSTTGRLQSNHHCQQESNTSLFGASELKNRLLAKSLGLGFDVVTTLIYDHSARSQNIFLFGTIGNSL